MIQFKKHTQIGLFFFLIAAALGLLLRFAFVVDFDFEYRNFVHTHSHVALMGWLHFGLSTLICYHFIKNQIPTKTYRIIFGSMLFSVIGMTLSFPFQGYGFFSILFSSTFLISTYFYVWAYFKYSLNVINKKSPSYIVIKYALIYMIISSIGPWSIGGVMATVGQDYFWYNTTIYFYLHFQYNAWLPLGLLGILLKILENKDIYIQKSDFSYFIKVMNASLILTFFISILFSKPPHEFYILSLFGCMLQFIVVSFFYRFIKKNKEKITSIFSPIAVWLLKWSGISFVIKIVMQFFGSFPYIADLVTANKFLAIGFLHWIFLGVLTLALFALLEKSKLISVSKLNTTLYLLGFIFTEVAIFYQPFALFFELKTGRIYYFALFIASIVLVISIALITFSQLLKKDKAV